MDLLSLICISIALSMDAFSVSICKGLAARKFSLRTALSCGLWFGFFQALMPLIGYFSEYNLNILSGVLTIGLRLYFCCCWVPT